LSSRQRTDLLPATNRALTATAELGRNFYASFSLLFEPLTALLIQFFDLHNRFLGNVNRKANLVSSFESFQLRRRLNAIAHRHRAHKAFDFSMIDDYLTAARDCCNDLAFAEESIQSGHPACSTIT
jgi:hypothetical protein